MGVPHIGELLHPTCPSMSFANCLAWGPTDVDITNHLFLAESSFPCQTAGACSCRAPGVRIEWLTHMRERYRSELDQHLKLLCPPKPINLDVLKGYSPNISACIWKLAHFGGSQFVSRVMGQVHPTSCSRSCEPEETCLGTIRQIRGKCITKGSSTFPPNIW